MDGSNSGSGRADRGLGVLDVQGVKDWDTRLGRVIPGRY